MIGRSYWACVFSLGIATQCLQEVAAHVAATPLVGHAEGDHAQHNNVNALQKEATSSPRFRSQANVVVSATQERATRSEVKQPITSTGLMSREGFAFFAIFCMFALLAATFFVFIVNTDMAYPAKFGNKSCLCLLCTPFVCCFPVDDGFRSVQWS
mmetsp:Transcript_28506/g.45846  ORF Transcript_28506/g.45846 Transcript_28506/m.45846 type:complete len:155 (-) Transcript_28506:51-515(-)